MFKSLIGAACAALLATVASAETLFVTTHDDWQTSLVELSTGELVCDAYTAVTYPDGELVFAVGVNSRSEFKMVMIANVNEGLPPIDVSGSEGALALVVDRVILTDFISTVGHENVVIFTEFSWPALEAIAGGETMTMINKYVGPSPFTFSLDGSRAAITAWMDCAEKIRGDVL